MAARASLVVVLALVVLAGPAHAQADRYGDVDPGWPDGVALGVMIPLDLWLYLDEPSATQRDPWAPSFDRATRDALALDVRGQRRAASASDAFLYSLSALGVVAPYVAHLDFGADEHRGVLVGAEAMLGTLLVTNVTKHLVRRQRPDAGEHPDHEAHASFFSGHTSMSFAGATMLTIHAYEYRWLDGDTRWVVPAVAYTAAASTGWLRMAARRHWLTDVLVGAAMGTGTSYAIYRLRD